MPQAIQPSFAAGELSTSLWGRVDLAKYHIGAALLRNFFVDYRGGATNRAGTWFLNFAQDSDQPVTLIPFIFNNDQTYVLEFGHHYMRVIRQGSYILSGGSPYSMATPYDGEDLATLKYSQSKDVLTLTHPDYQIRDLSRTAHDSWTLTPVSFDAAISPPASVSGTASTAGSVRYGYVVTSVDDAGNESVASEPIRVSSIALGDTSGTHVISLSWTAMPGAIYYNVYKTYPTSLPISTSDTDVLLSARYGLIGTTQGLSFDDQNLGPDFVSQPPTHLDPFAPGQFEHVGVTAGGSGYTDATVINIADPSGTGALLRPLVRGGAIEGVVVVRPGRDYIAPVLTATVGSGATFTTELSPATGNNPALSGYAQQRKVYAATFNEPQRFWMSRPGLFTNFDTSIPTQDDDGINAQLASQQANIIRSMTGVSNGLLFGTTGASFQVNGGEKGAILSPRTISATSQTYGGMSNLVDPIIIGQDIYYVKSLGAGIRTLSYHLYYNSYIGSDATVLSNHLFYGQQIVSWAYADEPFKIIWCVRGDGRLLSFTTLKDQEIYGWAQHDTRGLFEAVCTVPEGNEDVVYFVVRRFLQGEWKRCIERMASRVIDTIEDALFLDCALEYPLTPVNDGSATAMAASGVTTIEKAGGAPFVVGDIGKVIRLSGGAARIKAINSSYEVTVEFLTPITKLVPVTDMPLPAGPGEWSMTTPVTVLTGLEHLSGETVGVMGDGSVFPDATVNGGSVELNHAASRIYVGLKYPMQGQTLPLAAENVQQGRLKRINSAVFRLDKTRGLWAGPTFDAMDEQKQRNSENYGVPIPLFTGDIELVTGSDWTRFAQFCWEVKDPLPATILAFIPTFVEGSDYAA